MTAAQPVAEARRLRRPLPRNVFRLGISSNDTGRFRPGIERLAALIAKRD